MKQMSILTSTSCYSRCLISRLRLLSCLLLLLWKTCGLIFLLVSTLIMISLIEIAGVSEIATTITTIIATIVVAVVSIIHPRVAVVVVVAVVSRSATIVIIKSETWNIMGKFNWPVLWESNWQKANETYPPRRAEDTPNVSLFSLRSRRQSVRFLPFRSVPASHEILSKNDFALS